MTAIYPIYYWSSKGLISNIHLRNFALVMLPVIIVSFFTSKSNLQIEYDRENVVNNTSYLFVALMPFLFLIKNKNLSLIILFALLAFLVIGAKRGALIIGSVNTVIILFYNLKYMQSKNWKARMRNVLLFTIVFSIGMIYLSDIIESNSYVFERLENNQSTRPENYTALFNNWYNSTSIHHILFGYGYYSSPLYTPEKGMAHNDWLEMLNDFGLFGFILYAVLIISFIKLFKNKWPIDLKYMHITIIISWIFISLLSMWVNNYMNIMYAILMGYLVGNVIQNKRLLGK
ncbi:MAG: O-antigen ligase family protein [Brumimicrobium sp.]|nr:O-antigen ligase family protein [Brumimicrobium sp.]